MSDTIIDMPKVCQMLDNGWQITVWKNDMRTYSALGRHKDGARMAAFRERHTLDDWVITDDFTPEQALTRLAYKVHGEII